MRLIFLADFFKLVPGSKKNYIGKLGTEKVKKITAVAEELLEKWPSCDKTQVTESLQSVNELWEQFERDLLKHKRGCLLNLDACSHALIHLLMLSF